MCHIFSGSFRESMASKLPQLQTKVVQVSNFLAKNGNTYYKQLMEKNKGYIQEPPTIEKCQTLANQLFYTRLARFFICSFPIEHVIT